MKQRHSRRTRSPHRDVRSRRARRTTSPGFYAWDKNNFAPRVAVAWSPTAEGGFLRTLTGDGALIVRGGYTKVFDRVGLGLATNFDEGFAFGMSTTISSPFGAPYEENPAVRFVDTTTLPPTVPAAPPGGFPQTPPRRAGVITSEHRRHADHAVGAHAERRRRPRSRPQLPDGSRLPRTLRPRPAGAS